MFNERPIDNPNLRNALNTVGDLIRYYDLAGGVFLVNSSEWAYGYHMTATWNAHIDDPSTPLGFRIRARSAEIGDERAKELLTGSVFTLTSMQDFGNQTRLWAGDMIKLLRKVGLRIEYKPFNGQRLPRIGGVDMR